MRGELQCSKQQGPSDCKQVLQAIPREYQATGTQRL
jgi:hypothetical protein